MSQVAVVRASEIDEKVQTAQTKHLQRRSGVDAPNIWMGKVTIDPGKESGAHHHGEAETGVYVFSGYARILWGKNFEKFIDLKPGDFAHIPPYVPHIERNLSDTEPVVFITARKPGNIVFNLESGEEIEKAHERPGLQEITAVRADELDKQTDQTHNLPRKTGVNAPNLWMGRVTGEPGGDSGSHHHGEAETAGFILSGNTTILYGEGFEQSVDLGPGDFVYVPPFVPHIERNVHEEPVVFITARNPRNIVVNLE
jgi:uncharacterized RmlC-like cupin family protein